MGTHPKASSTSGGSFLFSPTLDSAAFLLPILLATVLSPYAITLPSTSVPLWAHFGLVVAVDVAHVWATAFRVYLDRRELMRRPILYSASPLVAFTGILLVVVVKTFKWWSPPRLRPRVPERTLAGAPVAPRAW